MKKRFLIFSIIFILCLNCFSVLVFASEKESAPKITAQNAIMINTNTGATVFEKEPNEQIYPASLTKMVTLLVAYDLITNYSENVTVSKICYDDLVVGSSNINLKDEEILTIDDMMYAVAISSANEAANMLAIHLCGDTTTFVDKMNTKVKELGANNTHFVNVHGLHDPDHYTTAYDMSLIAKAAFSNEKILEYLSTSVHVIAPTNKTSSKRTLVTTNNLIYKNSGNYYKNCKGGKTGTTTAAGYNLVSLAQKGDMEFILVAMNVEKKKNGTNTVFSDSKSMYNWAFDNYKNSKILSDNEIIQEVSVKLSAKGDHLILLPEKNIYSVVPIDLDITTLERTIVTQEEIFAPIKQGDTLGTITLQKDGVIYATTNLVAGNDVERSTVLYYLYLIEMFFKNIWVQIICIVLAVLVVIYVIIMISQNNRRNRKKLRRRVRF